MKFILRVILLTWLVMPVKTIANYYIDWNEYLIIIYDNGVIHLELPPEEFGNSSVYHGVEPGGADGLSYFINVATDVGFYTLTFWNNQEYEINPQQIVPLGIGYF